MAQSAIRKKGFLYKLPVKGIVKKWSKRWFVLHATSHDGVVRLEYFDNEACAKNGLGKRTIPLRDCTGLIQTPGDKTHPYVFEMTSQLGYHKLASESQPDLDEWIDSIKEAQHEDKMKRRQRKSQSLIINRPDSVDYADDSKHSSGTSTSYSDITEGTYRVTMEQNETAKRLNLLGEYNLEVSQTGLSLAGANTGASIAFWEYKFLKNYGKKHGRFHFETGKSSSTGAGDFLCVTTCSREIFGVVHRNIKKLRGEKLSEQEATLKRQVSEAKESQQKLQAMKMQGSIEKGHASNKRSSKEIPGKSITGTYRMSKDLDDADPPKPAAPPADDFDPSHVYSTVNKTKTEPTDVSQLYSTVNKPKKQSATEPPPKPLPYLPAKQSSIRDDNPFQDIPLPDLGDVDTNRYSLGSARDSRDSALVDLNFLQTFEEEEAPPLLTGATNPMGESFNIPGKTEDLINFDIDKLDDDFFLKMDQFVDPPQQLPHQPQQTISQQQFDNVWDDIFSTIPSVDQ